MNAMKLDTLPEAFAVSLQDSMFIYANGEQADSYLHGQLTVNINKLADDSVRYTSHCDNKGKAWSLSFVTRFNDGVVMLVNKDAGARSLAELNKYGVFSKVDITDESDHFTQLYMSNALAETLCLSIFSSLPREPLTKVTSKDGFIFKSDLSTPGYYVVLRSEIASTLLSKIAEQKSEVYDHSVLNALRIKDAIPDISGSTVGEYVPQMFNVQAINGIDFDKGCYMGQEVVARTRFLGKNKRAAFAFKIDSAVPVNVGDSIEKMAGEHWRSGGTVITAATLGNETWFMAVVANDTSSDDIHRLAENPSITCYPITLPYSIEQAASNLVKKRRQ